MISPRPPSPCRTSPVPPRHAGGHQRSHYRVDVPTPIDAGLPPPSHGRCRTRPSHRPGLQGCHEPVTVIRSTSSPPEAGHGAGRRGCAREQRVWLSPQGPRPAGPATHPAQRPFPGQPWPPAVAPTARRRRPRRRRPRRRRRRRVRRRRARRRRRSLRDHHRHQRRRCRRHPSPSPSPPSPSPPPTPIAVIAGGAHGSVAPHVRLHRLSRVECVFLKWVEASPGPSSV
jgi:hypothetical protein